MTERGRPYPVSDDRISFDEARTAKAIEMGRDDALALQATNLMSAVRAYDWSYQWSWLGLPIIQLPSDIIVMQEIIWTTRPQLVIETGVARGGSMVLYASLLELIGEGTVVGIEIDIREHNRSALANHLLWRRIELIEGSSVDPAIIGRVREMADSVERTMVVLDSDHSHDHVLSELRAYGPLVTPGQYLVVAGHGH